MGEREPHDQRLLLAGRGGGGGSLLRPVPDQKIGKMRADEGTPGRGVAAAVVAQARPVAVLRRERRPVVGHRLDLALKRELRPGKGGGIVALGGDQRLEPAYAIEPRRGDRDAELGRLALDRVEPLGVAAALFQKPVASAQSPFELGDPGP